MYNLRNEFINVELNDQANIVNLSLPGGRNIVSAPISGLWKMILKADGDWETVAEPDGQSYIVEQDENRLTYTIHGLYAQGKQFDITLVLTIWLSGDEVRFEASVNNRSDAMVTELIFPRVGGFESLGSDHQMDMVFPYSTGNYIKDIRNYPFGESPYREYNMLSHSYPAPMSMSWMSLTDGERTLYLASHDSDFYSMAFRAGIDNTRDRRIFLDLVRNIFVRPGEERKIGPSVLTFKKETWHGCATRYRSWMETWRKPVETPEWIQDMEGFFLVIMKQQFGHIMWNYNQLPELYQYAKSYGCDTLGLFGWYAGGHDNGYPYILPDEKMGGEEDLRKGIKSVQKMGGRVVLYCQGILIDTDIPFYQEEGKAIATKNCWGTPYYEKYEKYYGSEFLKKYTHKTFAVACPSVPRWQELMKENGDQLLGYGADGVLYDQIGGMYPYPCFDESHPHHQGNPSFAVPHGRRQLLEDIHRNVAGHGKDRAFMTEHVTDLYSQYVDALHGCFIRDFPAVFRYAAPGTVITSRNTYPYITPHEANFQMAYGLRREIEIRYEGDAEILKTGINEDWRKYAVEITRLKRKYADLLVRGIYKDREGIICDNNDITVTSFETKNQKAVVLWNTSDMPQKVKVEVPGYQVIESVTIINNELSAGPPEVLEQEQIAVIFCQTDI